MKLTRQQQKALHLGCKHIADTLNDAGLDMRVVLKPTVDIPWTKDSVKEYLIKPIMKAMTGKTSTKDFNKTGEIDEVWDVLMRHLGEKHGMEYVPFPDNPDPAPMTPEVYWEKSAQKYLAPGLSPSKPWRKTKGVIQ